MPSKTYTVKSAAEFPSWKAPCPECNAKYPAPAISARKDGTAAYCKGCGTNWKLPKPEGWSQLGDKLGVKATPEAQNSPTRVLPQKDGFAVMTEEFIRLRDAIEKLLKEVQGQ